LLNVTDSAPWGLTIELGSADVPTRGNLVTQSGVEDGEIAVGNLVVKWTGMHPAPRVSQRGSKVIMLLGHPGKDGKLDEEGVFSLFAGCMSLEEASAQLNGSFLIVVFEINTETLNVVTDRFASLPMYYSRTSTGKWCLALHLVDVQKKLNQFEVHDQALIEFLFLRRILGEKTVSEGVSYLRSGHILSLSTDGLEAELTAYWQPNYRLRQLSDREVVERLEYGLPKALELYQSDQTTYGLLMSGGLDSRAVLISRSQPFKCFTTCLSENNESSVAKEVALLEGQSWNFVPRPKGLLNEFVQSALSLTSAQQVFNECQFMGYGEQFTSEVNSMFIGLGLDIFFGGLYLPQQQSKWFGHQTLHNELLPLERQLASMYLEKVGYRLKQSNVWEIIRENYRSEIKSRVTESINEIMVRAADLGATGYDIWEYMHIHNLSRHYSFPMMSSIRTYMDCRAPALENELFDLSIRMTARQKLNGTLYQRALKKISSKTMNVRNANTNYPAYLALKHQTALKAAQFVSHRLFGTSRGRSPSREDRSWPSVRDHIEACPNIMNKIKILGKSEALASLEWLDMNNVLKCLADHHSRKCDHSIMINVLLGIEHVVSRKFHG
jgi:asparagine synthase (glutamine-hydrolysing)